MFGIASGATTLMAGCLHVDSTFYQLTNKILLVNLPTIFNQFTDQTYFFNKFFFPVLPSA